MMISRMRIVEMARLVSKGSHGNSGVTDASQAHDTAAFLPWHRYFIHVYEKALREQCAYSGHLTYVQESEMQTRLIKYPSRYWDWSLDWKDVTHAPVWDAVLGFGGDGNEKDLESIHGHCVTDGPFAMLKVLYVEKVPYSHCLSRGFATGENLTRFSGALEPTALGELLRTPDYATFNLGVENGPHLSIPRSIHGDFSTFTAPAGSSHLCRLSSVGADAIFRSSLLPPSHAA